MKQSREVSVINHRSELGLAVAVLASLMTFTYPAWPVVGPMALGDAGVVWTACVWGVAGAFIVAAWVVEDHPLVGRAMLVAGATALMGVGLTSGRIGAAWEIGPGPGLVALVPAGLGLVSAVLIGPVRHSERRSETVAKPPVPQALRTERPADVDTRARDAIRRAS
jgi:hypothetical protein